MLCLSVRAQLLRNRTLCPTYTRSRCIFRKWRMLVFMTIYVLSCGVNAAVQNVPTDMQIRSCGCANVHICACSHACLWRSVTDCTFISVLWLFSKWAAGSRRAWQQADVQASFWHRGGHPFRTPRRGPLADVIIGASSQYSVALSALRWRNIQYTHNAN